MNDEDYMRIALDEARKAGDRGEVPIGAVIVDPGNNTVIAQDGNRTRAYNDPCAHAEILVIRQACEKAGAQRIPEYDLYVTLEPCAMCAGAISFARIKRLVFAAGDPKGGGIDHGGCFFQQPTCHHRPEVVHGPYEDEAGRILRDFFKNKR